MATEVVTEVAIDVGAPRIEVAIEEAQHKVLPPVTANATTATASATGHVTVLGNGTLASAIDAVISAIKSVTAPLLALAAPIHEQMLAKPVAVPLLDRARALVLVATRVAVILVPSLALSLALSPPPNPSLARIVSLAPSLHPNHLVIAPSPDRSLVIAPSHRRRMIKRRRLMGRWRRKRRKVVTRRR